MTLNRDHEKLTMSADDCWRQGWYTHSKADIHMKAKNALEHDLSRCRGGPRQATASLDEDDARPETTQRQEEPTDNARQASRSVPLGTTPQKQPHHHTEEPHRTTTPVRVRAVQHACMGTPPHTTYTTITHRGAPPGNNANASA